MESSWVLLFLYLNVSHCRHCILSPIKVQFIFRTSPSTEGTQSGVEYMLSYLFHSQYIAILNYDLSIIGIWVPEVKGNHSPFINFSSSQLFSFKPCNLGQREFILSFLLFSNWEPNILLELLHSEDTLCNCNIICFNYFNSLSACIFILEIKHEKRNINLFFK